MSDRLKMYRAYVLLRAESGGLEWGKDGARIQQIGSECERLQAELKLSFSAVDDRIKIGGLYGYDEEICMVWALGEVDRFDFAFSAFEFLTQELAVHTRFQIHTFLGLAAAFGPAVVEMMFDELEDALQSMQLQYHRAVAQREDEETGDMAEIYAPPGTEDPRFEEAGLGQCQAGDECAALVSIAPIDIGEIAELIEHRDAIARRALRGEAVPA